MALPPIDSEVCRLHCSRFAGRLLASRPVLTLGVFGLCLNAAGLALMDASIMDAFVVLVGVALLAHGFGYGLFQVATLDYVRGVIPRAHHGVASSFNMVTRTVGVGLGVSAGSALFDYLGGSRAPPGGGEFLHTFAWVFALAAEVVVAAIFSAPPRRVLTDAGSGPARYVMRVAGSPSRL